MKKLVAILVSLLLLVVAVAGCRPSADKTQVAQPPQTTGVSEQPVPDTSAGPLSLDITSPSEGLETSWGFTRVRGTVSPASAVVSIENGGYANVEADGSFESDYIVLNEGQNAIRVTATTGREEITRTVNINYTLDLRVSLSPDPGPDRDWFTASPVSIGGRVSDPHAEVTVNGRTAEVGNDGGILATIGLEEGTNTLTAVARLGDLTATDTAEVIYVPPPPLAIEITAPESGFTSKVDMVKIAGTISDPGAHVVISITSAAGSGSPAPLSFAPARITAGGAFYSYVTLEKGKNRIEATAYRNDDRITDAIDIEYIPPLINFTSGPGLEIASPQDGAEYLINLLPVTGKVDDPSATVLVNGTEVVVAADGTFRGYAVLDKTGENSIDVIAINSAAKTVRTINVTFKPPLVVYLNAAPELGIDYTKEPLSVTGRVNKPEAIVTLNDRDVPVSRDGVFQAQVLLNEGSSRIMAVATLGDERDEMYILYYIENGVLGYVPGYSHFFDALLHYDNEIALKAGVTQRLPVTLETRKDGPGSFSGYFVYVNREYGLMPLPWPEGLDVYLEPPGFTAYPGATYNFDLAISASPELAPGVYYLHFYYYFETGFYGNGWIKVTVA